MYNNDNWCNFGDFMKLKQLLKSKLTEEELGLVPSSFEVVGSILIFSDFPKRLEKKEKIIADVLLKDAMDIDQEQLDLNKKYYNKMKKELGAKISAKFRMVDNRINLMINLQIAASVPVIE